MLHVADKTKFDQKSILNFENNTTGEASTDNGCPNLDSFLDSQQLMGQSIIYGRVQDQAFDTTHESSNFRQDIIQEQTNSVFACTFTSNKSSTSPTFVTDIKDTTKNTAKRINDLKNTIECSTDVDVNLTMQGLEKKVLEKTVQVINKGKCRFDYLYRHDREARGWSICSKCLFKLVCVAGGILHGIALYV